MSKKPQKKRDILKGLKSMGYYRAFGDPSKDGLTLSELLVVAKFYLCTFSGKLSNDPIWDEYTNEELLIEYYAHLFKKDKDAKQKFESEMEITGDAYEDFADFADREIEKANQEREAQIAELEETISFDPGDVIGSND